MSWIPKFKKGDLLRVKYGHGDHCHYAYPFIEGTLVEVVRVDDELKTMPDEEQSYTCKPLNYHTTAQKHVAEGDLSPEEES